MFRKFVDYLLLPLILLIFWSCLLSPKPNLFPTNEKPQIQLIESNMMIWYGTHGLKYTGWAERPVLQFEAIGSTDPFVDVTKLKKWDAYIIMSNELFIEIRLMDYAYVQIAYVKIVDLESEIVVYENEEIEYESKELIRSLNDESIHYRDTINVNGKNLQMKLANTRKTNYQKTYKNITLSGNKIDGKLNMMRPVAQKDIVVYQPINHDRTKFVYLTKGYTIPAKGELTINKKKYKLQEERTTSGYNIGRGIFDQQTAWVWIHGNGFQNGKRYGVNLGGGVQRQQDVNSTEDAFFIDDEMVKLKSAEIYEYFDDENQEWVFKTKEFKQEGDFEIYFSPQRGLNFENSFNYYFYYYTKTKQFLGQIQGRVMDKYQKAQTFKNISAYGEIFKARW